MAQPARTESQTACYEVMLHLDKAGRVFRMYARGNEMVTRFSTEVAERMAAFVGKYGDLVVGVRPASFEHEGGCITGPGLDELALALFRQGLTSLRFGEGFTQASLLDFLGLVRQGLFESDVQDDDLVTLLWRHPIAGLTYTSVLGYHEEGTTQVDVASAELVEALLLGEKGEVLESTLRYERILERAIPGPAPAALMPELLGVARETEDEIERYVFSILAEAWMHSETVALLSTQEARVLLELPLRRFLARAELGPLLQYARFLERLRADDSFPFKGELALVTRSMMSEADLRNLVAGLPGDPAAHANDLIELLRSIGLHLKDTLADLAEELDKETHRAVLEHALLELCRDDPAFFVTRIPRARNGAVAVRLLTMLAELDLARAQATLKERLAAAPPDALPAFARALSSNESLYGAEARELLVARAGEGGRVRVAVADTFRALGDRKVAGVLWSWALDRAFESHGPAEVQAILRALVVLDGARALGHIQEMLERSAWLKKRALAELQATAARALGASDTVEARRLLDRHAASSSEEVALACRAALGEIAARAEGRTEGTAPPSSRRPSSFGGGP